MKKAAVALTTSVMLLLMTGCAARADEYYEESPAPEITYPETTVIEQRVPEGGSVVCVITTTELTVAISCDWEGYHLEYGDVR